MYFRNPRREQPSNFPGANTKFPRPATLCLPVANNFYDVVRRKLLAPTGIALAPSSRFGRAIISTGTGGTTTLMTDIPAANPGTNSISGFLFWMPLLRAAAPQNMNMRFMIDVNGVNINETNGAISYRNYTAEHAPSTTFTAGVPACVAFRIDNSAATFYHNGVLSYADTLAHGWFGTTGIDMYQDTNSLFYWPYYAFGFWPNHGLNNQALREISANPWTVFAPQKKSRSVNTVSSGRSATLGVTEASDTIVSGATLPIVASANITEASDTISAGATDQIASLNATFTVTEASDTVLSGATLVTAAGLNVTEASDTVLSGATLPMNLGLNVTEANDSIVAGATDQLSTINATASITEASDTISSGATLPISGNASITEASDTYAASMDTGNPAVVISTAGAGKGGKRKLRILPDGNRLYASDEEVRKILETFYRKKTLDDVKLSPPKVQAKFKETPIPDVELVKFDKYVPKLYTLKTEKRMVQADYSLYLKSLKMREEENKFLSMILEMI